MVGGHGWRCCVPYSLLWLLCRVWIPHLSLRLCGALGYLWTHKGGSVGGGAVYRHAALLLLLLLLLLL